MSLSSKHPAFSLFSDDWTVCRDCYRGERRIKEAGMTYLPATSGMIEDGAMTPRTPGYNAYQAYKTRAVYHEFMSEAVETLLGIMWSKPPNIELPKALEPMLEQATVSGEGLEQLLRRINEQQLVTGRLGLLADFPAAPKPDQVTPYIALYEAQHIINWDDGKREDGPDMLNLVVLDETEEERNNDFHWEKQEKYRVLFDGEMFSTDDNPLGPGYHVVQVRGTDFNVSNAIQPSFRGRTLEKLPFVFINSKDLVAKPDDPPLLGLAQLCLAIYRGEADYRQALFLQGQDTLVVINGEKDKAYRIGANASINLKQGGDAKFIGANSAGLPEMRSALENDKLLASQKAGKMVDMKSAERQSGEALNTRMAAQTATLNQIALSGAGGLERLLKCCAEWVGANPDEVVITPNTDFIDEKFTGQDLIHLVSAKNMGAPLSMESIHLIMQQRGLTEKSLEEELDAIEEEAPLVSGGPGTVHDPDDPNYDPNKDPNYNPEKDPNSSRFKEQEQEQDEDE